MTRVEQIARRQLADYDRRWPGTIFAEGPEISVEEAYTVQREVARLREWRGERVAGYKIGCVSPVIQAQLGLGEPVFGYVFETEIWGSGVELDPRRYHHLAIEGELAVRLPEDVPSPDWLQRHLGEVASGAFPVIELHNYVFRSEARRAQELIANNAIHAGVVMRESEAGAGEMRVMKNGETLGTAGPVFAFDSLVMLARHLERRGQRLRGGQLILAGSPLPLYPVEARDRIAVVCEGTGAEVTATVGRGGGTS